MRGMVKFKLKRHYKLQRVFKKKKALGNLRIELLCAQIFMNRDLFDLLKVNSLLEKSLKMLRELWNRTIAAPEEAMDIGVMTVEEAAQAITKVEAPESVRIVAEISKSPSMPRPKKDKQAMVSMHVSPRNPLKTRLIMEEKGKAINLEANEEE